MEFMLKRNGEKVESLKTLTNWHPMEELPEETGDYFVIWHMPTGDYAGRMMPFSARYGLWGTFDTVKNAKEAIEMADRGITADDCMCWTEIDFNEVFKDGEQK